MLVARWKQFTVLIELSMCRVTAPWLQDAKRMYDASQQVEETRKLKAIQLVRVVMVLNSDSTCLHSSWYSWHCAAASISFMFVIGRCMQMHGCARCVDAGGTSRLPAWPVVYCVFTLPYVLCVQDRMIAAGELRKLRNKGVQRLHERLARDLLKKQGDDAARRMELLRANDLEAYQEMIRAQVGT
jgi:hypothetical protein